MAAFAYVLDTCRMTASTIVALNHGSSTEAISAFREIIVLIVEIGEQFYSLAGDLRI